MRTIEWRDGIVVTIDQTRLPHDLVTFEMKNISEVAEAIRDMRVRGAPLLGAVGAFGMALVAYYSKAGSKDRLIRELKKAAELLRRTRPTAVNLSWALNRILEAMKDFSGNGNNGKIFEAEWAQGKFGDALKFDGIAGKTDYVEVPGSASLEITEALTIEAWVNIEQHQADHIRIVCAYDAAVTKGYSLLLSNVGEIKTFLNLPGGWSIFTGQAIPEGEWTHLALTYDADAGEVKLYVNGEVSLEGAAAGNLTPRGMDPLYIGRLNQGDPETPDGMVDEIRISDVARTQEEIQEAMNGLARLTPVDYLDRLTTTWGDLKK